MNNGATCGTQQLKRLSVHYFELNHRDICIESISWQQIEQIIKETEVRVFWYCGNVNEEKRTWRKGEEHTQDKGLLRT